MSAVPVGRRARTFGSTQGAGNQLMNTVIAFCRSKGYRKIYLWTFEELVAARHLYEKGGFRLVEEHRGTQWGTEVNEQRFECSLAAPMEITADASISHAYPQRRNS